MLYLLSSLVSGCAALVVAGAGAGAFSYYSGNLVRTYDANYYEAVHTSSLVMEQLRFKATDKKGDGLKTVLKGERADNTPVTIVVEKVKPNVTKIGVRNGILGVTNVKASEMIHRRIGQQLKETSVAKKQSKSSPIKLIQCTNAKMKISEGNMRVNDRCQPESVTPAPTPVLSSPFTRGILYIYYTDNEKMIPAIEYNTLDRVANYLLPNPSASLTITSYKDSKGDPTNNLTISKKRANAIRHYLTGKGVAARQVSAEGYGATHFLVMVPPTSLKATVPKISEQ